MGKSKAEISFELLSKYRNDQVPNVPRWQICYRPKLLRGTRARFPTTASNSKLRPTPSKDQLLIFSSFKMRLPCLLQQLPLALLALSVNVASAQETQEAFQSDISRLLNVVTRSIYHHRDVFLRELTSNAGDALEKTRLLGLRQPEILKPAPLLNISIIPNPQENTLVIRDSGIGMSEQELRRNLGTIARSGTSEFMEKLEAGDAGNLIGQFGLGA